MTATLAPVADRLLTRRTVLFLLATVTAASSFYLLLTVVPLYAVAHAPAGGAANAGLATAALMLATVLAELGAPRLIDRIGRRRVLAASLLLLGPPALLLLSSAE